MSCEKVELAYELPPRLTLEGYPTEEPAREEEAMEEEEKVGRPEK